MLRTAGVTLVGVIVDVEVESSGCVLTVMHASQCDSSCVMYGAMCNSALRLVPATSAGKGLMSYLLASETFAVIGEPVAVVPGEPTNFALGYLRGELAAKEVHRGHRLWRNVFLVPALVDLIEVGGGYPLFRIREEGELIGRDGLKALLHKELHGIFLHLVFRRSLSDVGRSLQPFALVLQASAHQPCQNSRQFLLQFLFEPRVALPIQFALRLIHETKGKGQQFEALPEGRVMGWSARQEVGQEEALKKVRCRRRLRPFWTA